jgi:hypothetical protein
MIAAAVDRIKVETAPYPHVVIADALRDYEGLERDFPDAERFGEHIRSHGDLTYPDREYCRLIEDSEPYRNLHAWVYSQQFCEYFTQLFGPHIAAHVASGALLLDPMQMQIRPPPYEGRTMLRRARAAKNAAFLFPRLDLGIGRIGYGKVNGGRGVHVDNLTRVVSILVYVDDNPSMTGGEHRMFELNGYEPVIKKTYRPQSNLLVASLQSNLAFHDVNPVTAIVGVRKAFYMAVSCSAEIWKSPRDRRLAPLLGDRYRETMLDRIGARLQRWF